MNISLLGFEPFSAGLVVSQIELLDGVVLVEATGVHLRHEKPSNSGLCIEPINTIS